MFSACIFASQTNKGEKILKNKLARRKGNSPLFSIYLSLARISIIFLLFTSESFGFDRSVWTSQELGVRFSYDNEKWTEATPTQDSTVVAINWLSKKSGGLMASCYLGVYESGFGKLSPGAIHGQIENVAKSIKNNELKRSVEYKQISLEKRYSDNHPVIYLSRTVRWQGFDGSNNVNIYSLITAWNNKEIIFSCSSNIPIRFPKYKAEMEDQMMNVLRTLQFDR